MIALDGLRGVGDRSRPDWEDDPGRGIYHVIRLLTQGERDRFGIGDPRDIRGTQEEAEILACVFAEAPYLRGKI